MKKFKHRIVGAWKLLTGKAYAVTINVPNKPFVLRITPEVEVHYLATPQTNQEELDNE